jgi:hypothetical protein
MFRAESLASATAMLKAMFGMNGFVLPMVWRFKLGGLGTWLAEQGVAFGKTNFLVPVSGAAYYWIGGLLLLVWLMPNTQQIMANFKPGLNMPKDFKPSWFTWKPSNTLAIVTVLCAVYATISISKISEFIYFQF